jgi:hypothetical protein
MPLSSTKRALIAAIIIVCVLAAAAAIALHRSHHESQLRPVVVSNFPTKTPDILTLLPANAPAIGYADVTALRSLPDLPLNAALGLTKSDPHADREYRAFVRDTGFDYTRDLDKVAIAYWPENVAATRGGIQQNRALSIADGRFDQQRITSYALRRGKIVKRNTQPMYEVPGNPSVAFEFPSSTRIALASGPNADALLSGSDKSVSSARDPAMQALVRRVSGAPIFAVVRTDAIPSSFYSGLKNQAQLAEIVRSVKDISLAGAPMGKDLQIALDAECDSTRSALGLTVLLETSRMLGSIALTDPKIRSDLTKEQAQFLATVLRQAKVTHDGAGVRINFTVTPEMMQLATSH